MAEGWQKGGNSEKTKRHAMIFSPLAYKVRRDDFETCGGVKRVAKVNVSHLLTEIPVLRLTSAMQNRTLERVVRSGS